MRKIILYTLLLIAMSVSSFFLGRILGHREGSADGLFALVLRDMQQISYSSNAMRLLEQEEYDELYDQEAKSYYTGLAQINKLKSAIEDPNELNRLLIDHALESGKHTVNNDPQSLRFLETKFIPRYEDGSLEDVSDLYVIELIQSLKIAP